MSIILPGTLIVDGYISKTSYDSIPKEVKIILDSSKVIISQIPSLYIHVIM